MNYDEAAESVIKEILSIDAVCRRSCQDPCPHVDILAPKVANFGRACAAAAFREAAKHHHDIATSEFCGPAYKLGHEQDSARFDTKAAALLADAVSA